MGGGKDKIQKAQSAHKSSETEKQGRVKGGNASFKDNRHRLKKMTLKSKNQGLSRFDDHRESRSPILGYVNENAGRGDCFYHAMYEVLNGEGSNAEKQQSIRNQMADYVLTCSKAEWGEISCFLIGNKKTARKTLAKEIKKSPNWTPDVGPRIAAMCYKVNLVIHQTEGQTKQVSISIPGSQRTWHLLRTAIPGREHYESITPNPLKKASQAFRQSMEKEADEVGSRTQSGSELQSQPQQGEENASGAYEPGFDIAGDKEKLEPIYQEIKKIEDAYEEEILSASSHATDLNRLIDRKKKNRAVNIENYKRRINEQENQQHREELEEEDLESKKEILEKALSVVNDAVEFNRIHRLLNFIKEVVVINDQRRALLAKSLPIKAKLETLRRLREQERLYLDRDAYDRRLSPPLFHYYRDLEVQESKARLRKYKREIGVYEEELRKVDMKDAELVHKHFRLLHTLFNGDIEYLINL